jgi:hypothetical protein
LPEWIGLNNVTAVNGRQEPHQGKEDDEGNVVRRKSGSWRRLAPNGDEYASDECGHHQRHRHAFGRSRNPRDY